MVEWQITRLAQLSTIEVPINSLEDDFSIQLHTDKETWLIGVGKEKKTTETLTA